MTYETYIEKPRFPQPWSMQICAAENFAFFCHACKKNNNKDSLATKQRQFGHGGLFASHVVK